MNIVKVQKTPEAEFPYYVIGAFTGNKIKGFERRESAREFAEHINKQQEVSNVTNG